MAKPPRRWIRLDVGWQESDWLAELPPGSRLGWVLLLDHVKALGIGGSVKALTPQGAARRWRIAVEDVSTLLEAATADGALRVEDGAWTVARWEEYQQPDATAAERMRRYRSDKSRLSPLRRNERNVTVVTVGDGVTRRVTETETGVTTKENHPSDGTRKQPRKNRTQVPDDFAPAESHVTKAKASGLDLAVELEAFKNYHGSKGTLFLDVSKGFHTWLGNAIRYAKNGNGRKPTIAAEPILTAGQMRALEARIHA